MKKLLYFSIILFTHCSSANTEKANRFEEQASRVTIIRDQWGVPHVYGKTDADAVFGLMYAQCEESFERVERNYLRILGRMSEVEDERYFYQDLAMKILYDTTAAITDYKKAPEWLKKLLHAFADGINYYLYKHPGVKPLALKKFEPWLPLLFTDGAYISTQMGGLNYNDLKALYGKEGLTGKIRSAAVEDSEEELTGSNGFAVAPSRSASNSTLLFINPHVSFYFRTEVHMVSEEGLNVYGAATWGQFFIYQGFNENCGWMHTSSLADGADLYEEKITSNGKEMLYQYDNAVKNVISKTHFISYRKDNRLRSDSVKVFYTHHGPVLGKRNNDWLSLKTQNHSMNGLIQSWQRMKVKGLEDLKKVLNLRTNTSTNTMYADDKGNIAYWHGNYIPRRDKAFDWSMPVDGSTPASEWKGLHEVDEIIQVINPKQGWLQNCNSSPFSVSGFKSLREADYPNYMAGEADNFRSVHAIKELENEDQFTMDKMVTLGYDRYLALFDSLLPSLFNAYNELNLSDPLKAGLKDPIELLLQWDKRSSTGSVPTTIAVFWAYQLISTVQPSLTVEAGNDLTMINAVIAASPSKQKLELLSGIIQSLQRIYGSWKIPWGDINRYQRTTSSVFPQFDDSKASYPVGLASAFFGSLASFETTWQQTRKQYGVAGNSFVAVVEFSKDSIAGKKLKAKSIVTGGQLFDPNSKHFTDQAEMFIQGKFKDVNFYREDVDRNAERRYRPGAE